MVVVADADADVVVIIVEPNDWQINIPILFFPKIMASFWYIS